MYIDIKLMWSKVRFKCFSFWSYYIFFFISSFIYSHIRKIARPYKKLMNLIKKKGANYKQFLLFYF